MRRVREQHCGATVKPTPPLFGQIGHNRRSAREISQAAPHAEQLRAVNLVRGVSGSVLMVEPMFSENVLAAGVMYRERFTKKQRRSVKYFCADSVSPLLFATMRAVFPKLQCCALDPLHLAMAVEKATREREIKLPVQIGKVIWRFNPEEYGAASGGVFYQGEVETDPHRKIGPWILLRRLGKSKRLRRGRPHR